MYKKHVCGAKQALQRDLVTNLATEPCDILATYVATETLRQEGCLRRKPCDGPTMCQMAALGLKVMFHGM